MPSNDWEEIFDQLRQKNKTQVFEDFGSALFTSNGVYTIHARKELLRPKVERENLYSGVVTISDQVVDLPLSALVVDKKQTPLEATSSKYDYILSSDTALSGLVFIKG